MTGTAIPVILVDDHPLFLEGVKGVLQGSGEVEIVGQCRAGSDAIRLISAGRPRIAVLDIAIPEPNGIDVCRQLTRSDSPTLVIVLSAHEDRVYVQEAFAAGARAYVLKRSVADSLLHAVRAVNEGGVYLDPVIAAQHFKRQNQKGSRASASDMAGRPALTDREREVVRLIAFGFTSKEIANKLGVTSKSVETYKSRASEKLGVSSRAKLVQFAVLQGWMNDLPD